MIKKSKILIHKFHWLVITLSLLLTLAAWKISENQIHNKRTELFNIQSEQLLDQILKRMSHYEVALKVGAAAIQSISDDTHVDEWTRFSKALNLNKSYPGINGIGVIYYVPPKKLNEFIKRQHQSRPNF